MKNKKLVIIIAVIVLLILGASGFYVFSANKSGDSSQSAENQDQYQYQDEVIPTITEEELGLSLSAISNNRKILIEIENTDDLSNVEYQLSYTSKGDVPRGVLGQIDIKPGKVASQEVVLGTCSDVCHYDEGVESIELTLKITKTDGKTYQLVKTLEF